MDRGAHQTRKTRTALDTRAQLTGVARARHAAVQTSMQESVGDIHIYTQFCSKTLMGYSVPHASLCRRALRNRCARAGHCL